MSDPFTTPEGTINPFSVSASPDQYSIKLTTQRNPRLPAKLSVFSGTFTGDLTARVVGLQAVIMNSIETMIKDLYLPDYSIGPLPSLGKPTSFVFQDGDILVSYSANNDYFIFRGVGGSRNVTFVSLGQADVNVVAASSQLFSSSSSQNDYTVTHTSADEFTITDQRGRILFYDAVGGTYTYKGVDLDADISNPGTVLFTEPGNFTEVGITILPTPLPVDPNDILVAEGISGLIYDENTELKSSDLSNYIFEQSTSMTPGQRTSIAKNIDAIFRSCQNAIKHVINIPNQDAFSINNGYANFTNTGEIIYDIRVS